jgi:beta-N-acetylhexosaminidase
MIKIGAEIVLEDPKEYLESDQIGLITNQTGVTSKLDHLIDAFHSEPDINLLKIFGPEHGARGDIQDALLVDDHIDEATGLPVFSLYGELRKPTGLMLEGLDRLVFDIQDVGARFYTYVSTLTLCLEAAKEHNLAFTVLDRPNPINGVDVEGNILDPRFKSFIGMHPTPIRHGMTSGELSLYINQEVKAELDVAEMKGWSRDKWYDDTGLPWVQTSPNLPTLDTATVYPGTCYFEGVNASEGRGTTKPFEYLGAPWVNSKEWTDSMNKLKLPGVSFRSCHFTPTFWRYKSRRCNGLQVHVTDRNSFDAVTTGLHLLHTLRQVHPENFEFNPPTYDEHPHFDYLAGTDGLRIDLNAGKTVEDISDEWRGERQKFMDIREKFLLYEGNN